MTILVTGGAGYIGSHFVCLALSKGMKLVILDNFDNSSAQVLKAIADVTGVAPDFVEGDVRDKALLTRVMTEKQVESVVHFAGHKAVGESTQNPLKYYDNNVYGSVVLLQAMAECGVRKLVFSSSATVYGVPEFNPYTEDHRKKPFNPYGQSKSMVEDIMEDACRADPGLAMMALRYFNPIGAHPSGKLGEDPKGIPNNLMPYITKVAVGELKSLGVFGDDYDTVDGTGVRDYIHVMDLAEGHIRALEYLSAHSGYEAVNLGAGHGYSVLQVIQAFESVNGVAIPYDVKPRRDGDLAAYWADASKALRLLNWKTRLTIDDMVRDSWVWQSENPGGYGA
ncbi:MAG: UDP-glucose 4-epimerase GalE [Oceanospirillaceae bacterium]|nr:UDP-glucose 4-epimerase GalE [Oceanospirillaceae bacterium]MCP5334542.1 UDP-glucose 4-epimerase GalE [Oceanospirillaceae bacterium]